MRMVTRRLPLKCAMGFLDSILKKKNKSAPGAEGEVSQDAPSPEAPKASDAKAEMAAKLKGVLHHLDKIILGVVLIAVTVLSVLKMLSAKSEIKSVLETDTNVAPGGSMLVFENLQPTNLAELIEKSKEQPDAIRLEGTNHWVFNPRVWKELFIQETGENILIVDSPNEPLGVSALQVSSITNLKAYFNARAFRGAGTVRYEFTWRDIEYPVFPYEFMPANNPLRTFLPQSKLPLNLLAASSTGWLPSTNQAPKPLHGFLGQNSGYLRLRPELELLVKFNSATQPTAQQMARVDPRSMTIPDVILDVELIQGVQGGIVPYSTNSIRAISGVDVPISRGFSADFTYRTKYHKGIALAGFRVGRHLMIDGEVFRVFKITADTVSLVSDPLYGGNGKIYEKKWVRQGGGAVAPVQRQPAVVPVGG